MYIFENNSLYFETLITLIAKCLELHSSCSQLCFSTCIILCSSNKPNLLSLTSNLISVLLNILPATRNVSELSSLIFLQLLIKKHKKPLLYAQAFVLKFFHIFSPVSTFLSHEITIETLQPSKKCHLAKFCKVDMHKARYFIPWEKQVFLVVFSLRFPIYLQI